MTPNDYYKSLILENFIQEAPIDDFKVIDRERGKKPSKEVKPGEKMKPSAFSKVDSGILTSDKGIQKIKDAFNKTEQVFNMYFINDKRLERFAEHGPVDKEKLEQALGPYAEHIKMDPNAISIVFLGNYGSEKKPMTAWITAHRIGHSIQSSSRGWGKGDFPRVSEAWMELERDIKELIDHIILPAYGVVPLLRSRLTEYLYGEWQKVLNNVFNGIGTFKSARDKKITRPYEFIYEMFAQYLLTGKVKFRPLPKKFRTKYRTYSIYGNDDEIYNADLEHYTDLIEQDFERILSASSGNYFLM